MLHAWLALVVCVAIAAGAEAWARPETKPAPYLNTWLVLGTFPQDGPSPDAEVLACTPAAGAECAGRRWAYFDDRLFSRNYDDYQDLFSFYRHQRHEETANRSVYAHLWVHSAQAQEGVLRVGADNEYAAWLNGQPVASSAQGLPYRDQARTAIRLSAGWNRLLLCIGNREEGRLGFYCRLCDAEGNRLPGLTFSLSGSGGEVTVTLPAGGRLPRAWQGWPYVGARAAEVSSEYLRRPDLAMQASDYLLLAGGGKPPYRWRLTDGSLPPGLALAADGTLAGTVAEEAPQGLHRFRVQVTDATGAIAAGSLAIEVRERPNRWYEQANLVALIHRPESMPEGEYDAFAGLMRSQGYGLGMVISYNNGEYAYRWPSRFEPDHPDWVARYKAALEGAGLRFGMYIGNLNGPNHGGENGALLLVEEAVRRYRPAALWFDWAGWDCPSVDAIYSVVRTISPETVIVLNGLPTLSNGDWDVIVLEGWGAWGERMWDLWPFPVTWPKRAPVETWRMVADPAFEYSRGVQPDWQEYLRVQISLIAEGYVANLDHSPTIGTEIKTLGDSPTMRVHREIAAWANRPEGIHLQESYIGVRPGPLEEAPWGYDTLTLAGDTLYLHLLANPMGKTGMPADRSLTVSPLPVQVRGVEWLNGGAPVPFRQHGKRLTLDLAQVTADPIDTILKVTLAAPYPPYQRRQPETKPIPPGNLATGKPALLLSADGSHRIPASGFRFARYGVDGLPFTVAQGGGEWAWTYHVDLEGRYRVNRVVITSRDCYATEYRVLLSADGKRWQTIAEVTDGTVGRREHGCAPTPARYVRIQAIKPDGPDQPGGQLSIAELEVYAK